MKKWKLAFSLLGLVPMIAFGQNTAAPGRVSAQADGDICGEFATLAVGPYLYENNTWGSGKSQSGWRQCLQQRTVNGQKQIGWVWNWPGFDPSVFAYPEILFGWSPWGGGNTSDQRFPMKLAGMPNVYMDYDVEHTASGHWDLAPEVWLTRSGRTGSAANPGDITTEVMFWLDYNADARPAGNKVADVNIDGKNYQLYMANMSNGQATWTYLTYLGPAGQFAGRLNIDRFLKDVVSRGYASQDYYLSSIEFGDESSGGTGSTWVKSYAIGVNSGTTPPPPSGGLPAGFHQVANRATGKCLDIGGSDNGSYLQQWDCGGLNPANQNFAFYPTDNGYYRIVAQHTGKVLDVFGGPGAVAAGSKVGEWDYVGGSNQQWKPVDVGDGYYKFLARNSNRALDLPSCSGSNGLQMQIWDDLNNDCQKFRIK